MGPWGPKMGVPPKKAPIFKEDAFPSLSVFVVHSLVSWLPKTVPPHDDVVVVV